MQGGSTSPRQPFAEHLRELRRRVVYCVLVLVAGSAAGYALRGWLLHVLTAPLKQQLYYTSPLGGLNAVMKLSVLFGVVLMLPVAMYQLTKFLAPAFRGPKQNRPLRVVFASMLLAAVGIAVGYFTSLPVALHFFTHVAGPGIKPLIVVNDYLNFVTAYLVFYAILFQLPLIMSAINRVKPQPPRRLLGLGCQRWVVLLSFIVAALLTPTPDPVNQSLLALPTIALWQIGALGIWWSTRRQPQPALEPFAAEPSFAEVPPVVAPRALRPTTVTRYFDIIPPQTASRRLSALGPDALS